MPNVNKITSGSTKNHSKNCSCCSSSTKLDTLAQLSTNHYNGLKVNQLQDTKNDKKNLQKRARAKAYTNSFIFDLIDLGSPLLDSYWQTYYCSKDLLQDGKKLKAKYCNQRWCLVCNRIRTAKMINGYTAPIEEFKEPCFLTLTVPNVKAKDLKLTVELMTKSFRDITKNINKTYSMKIKGLRKYECTYNTKENTYHPHFHLIIDGLSTSNKIIDLWLKKFSKADRKGQDVKLANEGSLVELCKYFTKVIAKDNDYSPKALDIMFRAVKGKRTFQPIGIKKDVSEDVQEIQSQEMDFLPNMIEIYSYEKDVYDWVSASGMLLSEYEPTKEDMEIIKGNYG